MTADSTQNLAFTLDSVFYQDAPGLPDQRPCQGVGPSLATDGQLTSIVGQDASLAPLAEVRRSQGVHRRSLTIDVQEATCSEHSWDSIITCPSRLQGRLGSGSSPYKTGPTFDPFHVADDAPGCTPVPRGLCMSQPVAPRKVVAVAASPLASNPAARLLPGKPHSCPPGGTSTRASRPVIRVRVKRSLNLASGRPGGNQGQASSTHAGGGSAAVGEQQQQQQPQEDGGEGGQLLGGVRKRSELFSPPMPRKFSRSMEDIVAAGIMAKLQLADCQQQVGGPTRDGAVEMQL